MPLTQAVHDAALASEIVPAAHWVGAVEPVEQKLPAGQGSQSLAAWLPVALEYVVARHGSAAAAPCGQYDPAGQSLHVVSPGVSWYLPPAHAVHSDAPPLEIVPAAHWVGVVLPVEQKEPAGHGVQSPASSLLVALE